ncbi:MAG: hypothetical protein WC604_02785 [Candidatus Gracilibacteria bacterium]
MKKYILGFAFLSMVFLTGCFKSPIAFDVDYKKEFLDKIPDGVVYEGDSGIGEVLDGKIKLPDCQNLDYKFKPVVGKFNYEGKIHVDCKNDKATLDVESSYMIGLLSFADKYVEAVDFNNENYRKEALDLTKNCQPGDQACQVDIILKHFAGKIKYISDMRDEEHVEGVKKTLETGIGDCEDITIVLLSYLESLGVQTKMVLINGHAYGMACDLPIEEVKKNYVPTGMPFNYYPIDENTACFALEGTLGKDAYIGFDAGEDVEKLLIDPVSKEFWLLDSDGIYENDYRKQEVVAEFKVPDTLYVDGGVNILGVSGDNLIYSNYSCEKIKDDTELTEDEAYYKEWNCNNKIFAKNLKNDSEIKIHEFYTSTDYIVNENSQITPLDNGNVLVPAAGVERNNNYNHVEDFIFDSDTKSIVSPTDYIKTTYPDVYDEIFKDYNSYISSSACPKDQGLINPSTCEGFGFYVAIINHSDANKTILIRSSSGGPADVHPKYTLINTGDKRIIRSFDDNFGIGMTISADNKMLFSNPDRREWNGISVVDLGKKPEIINLDTGKITEITNFSIDDPMVNRKSYEFNNESDFIVGNVLGEIYDTKSNEFKIEPDTSIGQILKKYLKGVTYGVQFEYGLPFQLKRTISPNGKYVLNAITIKYNPSLYYDTTEGFRKPYIANELIDLYEAFYFLFDYSKIDQEQKIDYVYVSDINGQTIGTQLSVNITDKIINSNEKDIDFVWAGNKIIYTKNKNIYLAEIDEEKDQIRLVKYKLTEEDGNYADLTLSADGEQLFFVSDNNVISIPL